MSPSGDSLRPLSFGYLDFAASSSYVRWPVASGRGSSSGVKVAVEGLGSSQAGDLYDRIQVDQARFFFRRRDNAKKASFDAALLSDYSYVDAAKRGIVDWFVHECYDSSSVKITLSEFYYHEIDGRLAQMYEAAQIALQGALLSRSLGCFGLSELDLSRYERYAIRLGFEVEPLEQGD